MNDTTDTAETSSIEVLYERYHDDKRRENEEFNTFYKNPRRQGKYEGFEVDYGYHTKELGRTLQKQYNFTDKQLSVLMSEAYERYHSTFGDMFYGAKGLADFASNVLHANEK
jgi:hypothetical protein